MNMSVILPGLVQTNQGTELLAIVLACLRDPRPLDIRTDSEYVCKGASAWQTWCDNGWHGEHADLWDLFACELRSRHTCVHVSWVKGHAKQIDVLRGRTTDEDKNGNDGADGLAVAGASMHQVPDEVLKAADARKDCAKSVQKMMVSILKSRLAAEDAQHADKADAADRDLDIDVCMEFLDDVLDRENIQCDDV